MEGRRWPFERDLHYAMETSLHCQRAKSQESHWDLPMPCRWRGQLDFFVGPSRSVRSETGTSAPKFLFRCLQTRGFAGMPSTISRKKILKSCKILFFFGAKMHTFIAHLQFYSA